jgi:hypothetical protein
VRILDQTEGLRAFELSCLKYLLTIVDQVPILSRHSFFPLPSTPTVCIKLLEVLLMVCCFHLLVQFQ